MIKIREESPGSHPHIHICRTSLIRATTKAMKKPLGALFFSPFDVPDLCGSPDPLNAGEKTRDSERIAAR